MHYLNYNHFYYFWIIAREMSVTRAAEKLRLSQSTLSEQLKQFESILGQQLFVRDKQRLQLTESGQVAFDYAEQIFLAGEEMLGVFGGRPDKTSAIQLRVGAVGPLSKNLQYEFLKPVLSLKNVKLTISASPLNVLLKELSRHALDVVLSGSPSYGGNDDLFISSFLGSVNVQIVGTPPKIRVRKPFPYWLESVPLLLPTKDSRVRTEFDSMLDRAGVKANIKAEIEDVALLRVLALSGEALALVPEIAVSNELKDRRLVTYTEIPELADHFYAISGRRKFSHPLVPGLIKTFSDKLKTDH